MTSRRLQIVLSVAVIFVCTGFLVRESFFAPEPLAGRSELSECHFLLSHSYVDGADGMKLIRAAGQALEPHIPVESRESWDGLDEEAAMLRLEQMVQQASEGEELDRQQAIYLGMEAMVGSLNDPFTRAMDPEQYAQFQESLSSQPFGGIGVQLGLGEGGTIIVFKVFEKSPAAKAQVMVGDLVLSVEGRKVTGLTPKEVEEIIHGEAGTAVSVMFSRDGTPYALTLERAILKTRSVRSRLLKTPGGTFVAWITVAGMKEETGQELKEELAALKDQSPAGLILDLRDNMGGYVNAALAVSSQFLDSGLPVVEIKSRDGSEVKATLEKEHNTWPLLVLVNGHTASSAEIVAACLADYDRAVLVGERTFGKGSVQTIHEFESGGALKFTIARYTSPEGRVIDGTGLEPDVQLDEREVLSHCEELWKQTVR